MTRSVPFRLASLLWAILFLLTTAGEGFGLHPCPYHVGTHSDAAAEGEGSDRAAEHGAGHEGHGHGHHHGSASDDAGPTPDHSAGHHSGDEPCSHQVACQAMSGSAMAVDLPASPFALYAVHADIFLPTAENASPARPPYFLPYSLAPPARG